MRPIRLDHMLAYEITNLALLTTFTHPPPTPAAFIHAYALRTRSSSIADLARFAPR